MSRFYVTILCHVKDGFRSVCFRIRLYAKMIWGGGFRGGERPPQSHLYFLGKIKNKGVPSSNLLAQDLVRLYQGTYRAVHKSTIRTFRFR